MKKKQIPKVITDVGFDFSWSEKKVWALDLPVEDMNADDLVWHLDFPFWSTEEGYYDLKPREVVDNPEQHEKEYERIMRTDLRYPLDIMSWKDRWLFLDGLHRFVHAYLRGEKQVKVRKVQENKIPLIRK